MSANRAAALGTSSRLAPLALIGAVLLLSGAVAGFAGEQPACRNYDSLGFLEGPFGPMWTSSLDIKAVRVCAYDLDRNPYAAVHIRIPTGEVMTFKESGAHFYDLLGCTNLAKSLTDDAQGALTLEFNNGEKWLFRPDGKIETQVDPHGVECTFEYDSQGRLSTYQDQNGIVWTFTYNQQNKVIQITDGYYDWEYAYDQHGNLTDATYPDGGHIVYKYESDQRIHLLTSVTNRNGEVVNTFTYDFFGRVATYTNQGRTYVRTYGDQTVQEHPVDDTSAISKRWYDSTGHLTSVQWPNGAIQEDRYDASGNLIGSYDPTGHVTYRWHDDAGNTTRIVDPLFNVTRNEYNSENRLIATTDPLGNTTRHEYDSVNNLTATTDALDRTTTYTYTTSNVVDTIVDPAGNTTTNGYDEAARVTSQSRTLGSSSVTVAYTYDDEGNRDTVTDALGRVTDYVHDDLGRVTDIYQPEVAVGTSQETTRPVVSLDYDAAGNTVARVDPNGNVTTAAFDPWGNKTSETDALGNTTRYGYSEGRLTCTTDPLGRETHYEYDLNHRLERIIDAGGGETVYGYDGNGFRVRVIDARGHTTVTTTDELGRAIAVTAPDGSVTRFGYDSVGNLIATTDALGNTTQYSYDGLNPQLERVDPDGTVTRFEYDLAGNRTAVVRAYGTALQVRDEYIYDSLNRVASITRAVGTTNEVTVNYGYDLNGNVITVVNGRGKTWAFSYDATNRLTSKTDPLGRTRTYKYDAAGHVVEKTDPKGQRIGYNHDAAGRMVEARYFRPDNSEENVVRCQYDAVGNMLRVTDTNVAIEQTFDALNRVTAINHHHLNRTVLRDWDAVGNLTSLSVAGQPNSTATYTYDNRNRVTAIQHATMGNVAYTYNGAGQKTSLTLPNGIVCSYTHDANGRLTALEYRRPDDSVVFSETLTYDARGNITRRVDTEGQHDYGYDWLDQLTSASYPDGAWEQLTYDGSGNRSSLTTAGGVTSYYVDDADQLTATAGPGTTEAVAFAWTPNGEMASQLASGATTPTSYYWDTRSMLVAVSLPSGQVLTYSYLPEQWLGWRLTAPHTSAPVRFMWDPWTWSIMADIDGAGQHVRGYLSGLGTDEHLAQHLPGTGETLSVLADHLGSVASLTDTSCATKATYAFAAFGAPRVWSDPYGTQNRFGFTGREWTPPLEQYYYRARWLFASLRTPDMPVAHVDTCLYRARMCANSPGFYALV
ncbi:MAG: hypothetical protein HY814_06315, partial [Candidatus Riflebacteria bacterium]|nr:hypothetical protein [Candidatus Riflebacteria bacterium]